MESPQVDSSDAHSPQLAVFAIAELLDIILSHAPARTLFVSQCVSRQFRDAVASSPRLQRKMFLRRPDLSNNERWTVLESPLRVVRFDITKAPPSEMSMDRFGQPLVLDIASTLNPIFAAYPPGAAQIEHEEAIGFEETTLHHQQELMYTVSGPRGELLLGDSSWRMMYLCDRPCKKAWLWLQWFITGPTSTSGSINAVVQMNTSGGFTLGSLVDAALDTKEAKYRYKHGEEYKTLSEKSASLRDMIGAIERTVGGKAMVKSMDIGLRGVMMAEQDEREKVVDA